MVDHPLVALGREETERDPEDDGEEARGERELDRRREALPELGRDRLARDRAVTELERRQLLDVLAVLHVDGLVEPVLVLDRRHVLRSRALAKEGGRRAAGQRPDPEEDEDETPRRIGMRRRSRRTTNRSMCARRPPAAELPP